MLGFLFVRFSSHFDAFSDFFEILRIVGNEELQNMKNGDFPNARMNANLLEISRGEFLEL
jgi:hypothetical protein